MTERNKIAAANYSSLRWPQSAVIDTSGMDAEGVELYSMVHQIGRFYQCPARVELAQNLITSKKDISRFTKLCGPFLGKLAQYQYYQAKAAQALKQEYYVTLGQDSTPSTPIEVLFHFRSLALRA